MAQLPDGIASRLRSEDISLRAIEASVSSVEDAEQTIEIINETGCKSVVLDGYRFDAPFQKKIKSACETMVLMDDYAHLDTYHADFILNQTFGVSSDIYNGKITNSQLLLGTDFALLRREFRAKTGAVKSHPLEGRKILVSMGGADPVNYTAVALEALRSLPSRDTEAVVVVGGANSRLDVLRTTAQADGRITIRHDVQDMTELMEWADVVLTAGGSTCWELALFGLPMIIVVLVENQRMLGELLAEQGAALLLGGYAEVEAEQLALVLQNLLADREQRESLGRSAARIIDGRGAEKVARLLMNDC